jgi:hypothetical protein
LAGLSGWRGGLVVSAPQQPPESETFLLGVLVRQSTVALENSGLYREALDHADVLRAGNDALDDANRRLVASVGDLERRSHTHELLIQASTAPDVLAAVCAALRELTGMTSAVQDLLGHVISCADADGAPAVESFRAHDRLTSDYSRSGSRGTRPGGAHRAGNQLVAVVRPGTETLGAVVLVDESRSADEYQFFVLEHAASVVGMELAHRRSMVELELRLRHQLVDDLVTGTSMEDAVIRATALGHDLRGPHQIVVVRWNRPPDYGVLSDAAERVSTELGLHLLAGRKSGDLILLVDGVVDGSRLFRAFAAQLGGRHGSIGIGTAVDKTDQLPRSYGEALRALQIRVNSRTPHGATAFDDLGLYQVLALSHSGAEMGSFVTHWLGSLIDYDTSHNSSLVETVAEYLDRGGSYDLTAEALVIHRSTLRYRLRRIRELSGLDLKNVETRLNVHVATRAWRLLEG